MNPDESLPPQAGRVTATGLGATWGQFLFTPDDRDCAPFHFQVPSGGGAFLLHGILRCQPELSIRAAREGDGAKVVLALAPAFAQEWEDPRVKAGEHLVPVRFRRRGRRPSLPGNACPSGGACNHHPVYLLCGTLLEAEGQLSEVPAGALSPSGRAS